MLIQPIDCDLFELRKACQARQTYYQSILYSVVDSMEHRLCSCNPKCNTIYSSRITWRMWDFLQFKITKKRHCLPYNFLCWRQPWRHSPYNFYMNLRHVQAHNSCYLCRKRVVFVLAGKYSKPIKKIWKKVVCLCSSRRLYRLLYQK